MCHWFCAITTQSMFVCLPPPDDSHDDEQHEPVKPTSQVHAAHLPLRPQASSLKMPPNQIVNCDLCIAEDRCGHPKA